MNIMTKFGKEINRATYEHTCDTVEDLKNIRYCMHATITDYPILEENTSITFELIQYLIAVLRNYGEISIRSHEFIEITSHLID